MNTVNLIGRLTKDPELQQTQSGHRVTSFSVAVDRNYKAHGDTRQSTDFFTVVAWNVTAAFVAQHFKRGQRIGITGHLQSRQYTDKEGNKRTAVEVVAESVCFAGNAPNRQQEPEQPPLPEKPSAVSPPQPTPAPAKTESDFQFLDEPDDDFDFVL